MQSNKKGQVLGPFYTNKLALNIDDSSSTIQMGSADAIKLSQDIKFTMLINASLEPYEGGKFFIFGNGGEREVGELAKPGNVVILKSSIPHRVTPVTKGKRHSITLFYSGPKFQ